jgi:hypothetical protein
MDCVSSRVDAPLEVDAGRLSVSVSGDDDQVLTTGSDGGLYVPGCAAGAVAIADTSTVDLAGAGQVGNPLTATWLGDTTTNFPDTGVRLEGNGTPGSPLHANWGGVNTAVLNPEITVTGNGTPDTPLTLAWSGLPWTKFNVTAEQVASGDANVLIWNWALVGSHGAAGISVGGTPANSVFTCNRAGAYIMLCRQRFLLNAAQTINGGYFQMSVIRGTSEILFDSVINTYGGGWVDLNYVELVQLGGGDQLHLTLFNNTGSNMTVGTCFTSFFRISN